MFNIAVVTVNYRQTEYINEEIFKNELKRELITNLGYYYIDKNNYKLLEGFLADEIRLDLNNLFDIMGIFNFLLEIISKTNSKMNRGTLNL